MLDIPDMERDLVKQAVTEGIIEDTVRGEDRYIHSQRLCIGVNLLIRGIVIHYSRPTYAFSILLGDSYRFIYHDLIRGI